MTVDVIEGKRGRIALGFDLQGALAAQRNLGILAANLPLFQKRAIGTLRRKLLVQARRDIQREPVSYNIDAARVRKDLAVRDTQQGLKLTGYWRGIGLRNFSAKRTRKGISSVIFRGRKDQDDGAFFARLLGGGAGNLHVVERFGPKVEMQAGRYKGKRRQKLQVLYGPTVAQMLAKGRRPERLAEYARGLLGDEIERQIEGYTKGRPIPGADN